MHTTCSLGLVRQCYFQLLSSLYWHEWRLETTRVATAILITPSIGLDSILTHSRKAFILKNEIRSLLFLENQTRMGLTVDSLQRFCQVQSHMTQKVGQI